MRSFRRIWSQLPKAVRRPLVFVIGLFIVLAGLALLVLPGPGWVLIFVGFAVLATEFAFAEKVRDRLVRLIKTLVSGIRKAFSNEK